MSLNRTASITTPLSPRADLIGAIVTIVFSAIIEGAFLIAPFYFANAAFRSITPHARLALQSLGFRQYRIGRTLLWIVLLMLVIFAINTLYSYLITALHLNVQTNDQLILQQSKIAPLTTYATLFAAVAIAPFCEEVFFGVSFFQDCAVVCLSAGPFSSAHSSSLWLTPTQAHSLYSSSSGWLLPFSVGAPVRSGPQFCCTCSTMELQHW